MFNTSRNRAVKRRSFGCSFRQLNLSLSSGTIRNDLSGRANDNSNVKVVVRVRPENSNEISGQHRCVVHVPDEALIVFDPEEESNDFFFQGKKQNQRDILRRAHKNKSFCFDRVFDAGSTNQDVYEECALPVIDGLLNGFNCSVFAYGATGSGKTHTMLGNSENPGIIFRIVMELYDRIGKLVDKSCDLSVSYLEVYNENIKDLICPSKDLQIREDSTGSRVNGLSIHKPKDAANLLELLEFGNKNRTQHPTDANKESSRSHAVFQVYMKLTDNIPSVSENVKFAKMSLIDLAGSERANVIQNRDRVRLREGANINQSLLALGSCINALADKKKAGHIPYRNSKLTRILKDSLGGNCQTVMIAAVSPSSASYDDTYNTLNYADRAKQIKIILKRNAVNVDAHISKHKKIMEALQKENALLRHKLSTYETATNFTTSTMACQTSFESSLVPCIHVSPPKKSLLFEKTDEILQASNVPGEFLDVQFKEAMNVLFTEKTRVKVKILFHESENSLVQERKKWKELLHKEINSLTWNKEKLARSETKFTSTLQSCKAKKNYLALAISKSEAKLSEVEQEMSEAIAKYEHSGSEICQHFLRSKQLEMEKTLFLKLTEHMFKFAQAQKKECESVMKLSEQALIQLRDHQLILKGHRFLTPNLQEGFESLLMQLECRKEVKWVDTDKPEIEDVTFRKTMLLPSLVPFLNENKVTAHCTSTPGPGNNETRLAAFLSPDRPGDHSYIEIGSNDTSPNCLPLSEEACANVSPIVRSKSGSPHPIKLGCDYVKSEPMEFDPVRRSLEETFSLCKDPEVAKTPNSTFSSEKKSGFCNLNSTFSLREFNVDTVSRKDRECTETVQSYLSIATEPSREEPFRSKFATSVALVNSSTNVLPPNPTTVTKVKKFSSTTRLVNPVAPFSQERKHLGDGFKRPLLNFGSVRTPLKEKVAPSAISKPNSVKKWLPGASTFRQNTAKHLPKENNPLGQRILPKLTAHQRMWGLHKSQSTSNLPAMGKNQRSNM